MLRIEDLGMDEYLEFGLHAALDAVTSVVPGHGVHAAGYCLGGTLLAIGASAMARDGDTRLVSVSLFAAQTDFSEPGELESFHQRESSGAVGSQHGSNRLFDLRPDERSFSATALLRSHMVSHD